MKAIRTCLLVICVAMTIPTHALDNMCDEWNVLEIYFPDGVDNYLTFTQYLSTDTLIDGTTYTKLMEAGKTPIYVGAMREDNNRNVYFIPQGSTHEFMLYAFNAKVGDQLTNLWCGDDKWNVSGYTAVITNVVEGDRKTYVLSLNNGYENWEVSWIEGVGYTEGPTGGIIPPGYVGDMGTETLCAYKNGELVYTSSSFEKFGCYYSTNITQTLESESHSARKFLRDGQLLIETPSGVYNAQGKLIE